MATFRCKRSGNTVSMTLEGDIQGMRKHEGYEEVLENGEVKASEQQEIHKPLVIEGPKRRGRPPRK